MKAKSLVLGVIGLAILAVGGLATAGCGGDDDAAGGGGGATQPAKNVTLRLGYFPNITHAQPLVGVGDGTFQKELGEHVKLETKTFNAGPAAIEALFAGQIDAAYVGPNPTINGYVKSNGDALRVVSGAASAGALFIVRPEANITKPADLAGKKFATPQLGGTQDVALRAYVQQNGLKTKENGGNVTVLPTANADTLTLFKKGDIDGAWLPEPWATRLVKEAGGRVFIDERTLWVNGDFVTTNLVVRWEFLRKNPEAVERLIRANVQVTAFMNREPEKAKALVNEAIKGLTGAALSQEVIDSAWANLKFTHDPLASTLRKSATDAFKLGFLGSSEPNLQDLYALDPLNQVLKDLNLPAVAK